MNAKPEVHWFSARKWEVVFSRLVALLWIAVLPLLLVMLLSEGNRSGAIFFSALTVVLFRLWRSAALGIAVLPDAIVVSPILSLGSQRIPVESIGSAVYLLMWQGDVITIYRRNRLLPPVILITSFMSGYGGDDWELLLRSLRALLEPVGKWEEAPWWKPWFPF
ncbi:MAG: hypothetical protein MUQ65_02100 [Armatimonadetes bacterium]|nr:hypothetical protein [Armatimonadota bacterium]